jgi:hypothetical protein
MQQCHGRDVSRWPFHTMDGGDAGCGEGFVCIML